MGVEVKASDRWRTEFGGPLQGLMKDKIIRCDFGVYTGKAELKDDNLRVLPMRQFFEALAKGDIFA